jgi:hypothetical protein
MEYLDPERGWTEGREKEGHVAFTYETDGTMNVQFQTMQDWYISDLVKTFGQMTASGALPNDVQIECRFKTTDDVSGHTVYDEWVLTITGTTETENTFCEFSGLSIANQKTTGSEYKVSETGTIVEPKQIWLSANLEGIAALDKKCA